MKDVATALPLAKTLWQEENARRRLTGLAGAILALCTDMDAGVVTLKELEGAYCYADDPCELLIELLKLSVDAPLMSILLKAHRSAVLRHINLFTRANKQHGEYYGFGLGG